MANVPKRLEDDDVRAVFECLHEGKSPPMNLPFHIVPVKQNGLKLSPPSYQFPDGLYVLLRPRSKSKSKTNQIEPSVPPHLAHLVLNDNNLPSDTCPWSLSGPQFPQPTAIQQRYCYPKGDADYSSQKGGALWTMYRKDGKEDLEFRLLHVYFSAKRAVNKTPSSLSSIPLSAPEKRFKQQSSDNRSLNSVSIAHECGGPSISNSINNTLSTGVLSPPHRLNSPAVIASTCLHSPSSIMTYDSPLNFVASPTSTISLSSPKVDMNYRQQHIQRSREDTMTPQFCSDFYSPSASTSHSLRDRTICLLKFHPGVPNHPRRHHNHHHCHQLLPFRSLEDDGFHPGGDDYRDDGSSNSISGSGSSSSSCRYSLDPLPYEGDSLDMELAENDRLLNFFLQTPQAVDLPTDHRPRLNNVQERESSSNVITYHESMVRNLDLVHESIRERILECPSLVEQSALVHLVVHWARQLATDPLTAILSLPQMDE